MLPITLGNTIDYQIVLQIVEKHCKQSTELLETLVMLIEDELVATCKQIKYLYISIQKKHPPLGVKCKSSEIILEKNYTH